MQLQGRNHWLELPDGVRGKLIAFRNRVWLIKLAEGLLAAGLALFLSFLLVFVLDRVSDTPVGVRAVILVAGAMGLGVWFPLKWHRWVWRSRRLDQVARLVGHKFPRLGDHLLGIVELVQSELEPGRSEALCRAALKQVDQEARQHDFADAVPNPRHRWWAWAASVPLAAVLVALVFTPAAGGNALVRWLLPWKQTPRYTFAQLEDLPDRMVVPLAEPFSLTVTLSKFTAWSPPYASARYGQQDTMAADLHVHGYTFNLPPQKEDHWLNVSVGDAKKAIQVRPTTRPELTSITASIRLPDYLQHSAELTKDVRGGSVSLLNGSQVTFLATATRNLSEAAVDGIRQPTEGNRLVTSPTTVTESMVRQFSWQDHLGLSAKEPFQLSIRALDDEPPTISCTRLSRQPVLLDGELLSFQVRATDDFGVKQIGLEWSGVEDPVRNPDPTKGEKLVVGGGPDQREVAVTATFSAQREGVPPQLLQVRLFVVDYLPGRQRVYSPAYTLHVLSSEEHAIWLTSQLRQWFGQSQEVYEHEQRLYETNKQLRSLSSEEIDLADNRRRILAQAAAEQDSARRLETLATTGQQLVAEATRNEQFHVTTLENWAQMLQALRRIAQNRMPSVANLLRDAAQTPGSVTMADSEQARPDPNGTPGATQVGINRDGRSGGSASQAPTEPSKVPSIVDMESSFNDLDENPRQQEQAPSGFSPGGLGLPTTMVLGGGQPSSKQNRANPAQQQMEKAVEQQQDLLAEFAKAAEELRKILNHLEGSTFVKRFKAASRRQLEVANELNQNLLGDFGLGKGQVDEPGRQHLVRLAERETAYSDDLYVIQDDLDAYFNRVQQGKFKTVVSEMKDMQVVSRLRDIAHSARENLNGQAIALAEFWADTLDRWAEQLVGPEGPNEGSSPDPQAGSLPPATVLEVLRILEKEIGLREETRSLQQVRAALAADQYGKRSKPLSDAQADLARRTADVTRSIRQLPEGETKFGKEAAVLSRVEQVMNEAFGLLSRPETGPETIAAETEAIELLLQTRRAKPAGSGGRTGGGSTAGAGGSGSTDKPALALLDVGQQHDANVPMRLVNQATGVSGTELPAEYRGGLDAYFGALEADREGRAE